MKSSSWWSSCSDCVGWFCGAPMPSVVVDVVECVRGLKHLCNFNTMSRGTFRLCKCHWASSRMTVEVGVRLKMTKLVAPLARAASLRLKRVGDSASP